MKTRMKKLISIKSIPMLMLALLFITGLALAAGRAQVSGSGTADLNLSTGAAVGQADLSIGVTTLTAEVSVQLTSQVVSEDGVLHATATHTFTFSVDDNGEPIDSITTTDKGVIDTDGTLNEHLTIVSGTGDFEGATGELAIHGQVQFMPDNTADISFDIRGVISR